MTDSIQRVSIFRPTPRLEASLTIYEAELAEMLSARAVRQLLIARQKGGWMLQVLPTWKKEFMTLVSLKKEVRYYQDIDRLIRTIEKQGPLPPTLVLGEPP